METGETGEMILGTIQFPTRYGGLGEGVKRGLAWLADRDLNSLEPGRYEIDGDKIFLTVSEVMTKAPEEALFEAHRRYIDIHITISGEEWFGHAILQKANSNAVPPLEEVKPYDEAKDVAFYKGDGVYMQAPPGHFVLFMPEDAHKPSVCFKEPGLIKKLVLKVLI